MGWYDNANYSSGKSYYTAKNESVLTYNVAKDITLYAGWSKNSDPSYTVTFNTNGGSGGQTSSVTVKKGSAMPTINTTAPTRTGYTFAGWYDSLSGGTMYYSKEGKSARSYDKTSGCTLYARWNATTYKISYSVNGGTLGSSSPTSAAYDKVITINNPSKTFTVTINSNNSGASLSSSSVSAKQGFLGWTASSNLNTSTAKYGSNTSTTNSWNVTSNKVTSIYFKNLNSKSGTVTLSANWKANTFKLPTATKAGYTCGFSTSSTGTTTYSSGATYTPSITAGSTKLYVICNKATFVLTYNANGGSVSPTSKNLTYGSEYGTLPTPTRSGYTFNGWYTAATAGSKVSSSTKIGASNTTIYAQWTAVPATYTVTYNANGGSGTMTPSTATYNTNFVTSKNTFTRSGYTFKGWNEKADGSGTAWTLTSTGVYENGNGTKPWKWTYTKNITLYAQWQKNGVTLRVATYNAGYFHCGSASSDTYKCTINGKETTKEQMKQYVIDVVKNEKIDIIGLQEVRHPWLTTDKLARPDYIRDIINELKKSGYDGWYVESGQNYNAIISNKSYTKKLDKKLTSGRKLNGIEFTVNNVKMTFYNTHLGLNNSKNKVYNNDINFGEMLEAVKNDTNPMIITGDFNNNSRSAFNNMLNAGFEFAGYEDSGENMHKNSGLKIAYMDSILVRPYGSDKVNHIGYTEGGHRVIITNHVYSDHNMVIVDLTIY